MPSSYADCISRAGIHQFSAGSKVTQEATFRQKIHIAHLCTSLTFSAQAEDDVDTGHMENVLNYHSLSLNQPLLEI